MDPFRVMYDDERLNGYSRPDLIRYVVRHCVPISDDRILQIDEMKSWCNAHVGDERPGSILFEAMEGWLDYFDGEWSHFPNELEPGGYLFWFGREQDRVLFSLTWS